MCLLPFQYCSPLFHSLVPPPCSTPLFHPLCSGPRLPCFTLAAFLLAAIQVVTGVVTTDVTVRATPVRHAMWSKTKRNSGLDGYSLALRMEVRNSIRARRAWNRVGRTSTCRQDVLTKNLVEHILGTMEPAPPAQTSGAMPASTARAHAPAAQLVAIPSPPLLLAAPRAASPWRLSSLAGAPRGRHQLGSLKWRPRCLCFQR